MIIDVLGLHKSYKTVKALNGVSLSVEEGSIFGLLGPNGAGKSTLVGILTTILAPDSGTAKVAGLDIIKNGRDIRAIIGVVPQENNLDRHLTARENLVLHGLMHGMPRPLINKRADKFLEAFGLLGRQNEYPDTYSLGMQRRLTVARAFMHEPRVIFLDEPTTGLDPQSRNMMWEFLDSLKGEKTVLLTTHYMPEADALCDKVAIIDHGSVVVQGAPAELKNRYGVSSGAQGFEEFFLSVTGKEVREC